MKNWIRRGAALGVAALALGLTGLGVERGNAADNVKQIARGKYLVSVNGCNDCHTPGYLLGKPDMNRFLGGSDVGFEIPGLGVFIGPNLTPDKETGLGDWTEKQIVTAFTTGVRPDGRQLAPVMPWRAFANYTKEDAAAVAAYLKSLPPVKHKVDGPFASRAEATSFVMSASPGGAMPQLPGQPPAPAAAGQK